jgi:hypothetical protein
MFKQALVQAYEWKAFFSEETIGEYPKQQEVQCAMLNLPDKQFTKQ